MQRFLKLGVLLLLLVTGITRAWSADGRILSFEGDVLVNGQPVTATTELNSQDIIATAAGASVKIVLADNSVLDLDSDTEIRLSDYSYSATDPQDNKSDINVVEGTLRYVSGLIAKEDPEDIGFTAGNSTIGVRGSFTEIEVDGVIVNVEAMIGEATLTEDLGGTTDTIVVPTGKTTQKDPGTGKVLLAPATKVNKVNAVVHAIAAAAPDSSTSDATDESCSRSDRPLRTTARPDYDPEAAAAIEAQLAELSNSELMMVIAVLINNAKHLCIDTSTVTATIALIATISPDAAGDVIFTATLLDPAHTKDYVDVALEAAPDQARNILQGKDTAQEVTATFSAPPRLEPRRLLPTTEQPLNDVPPGGTPPPVSPE